MALLFLLIFAALAACLKRPNVKPEPHVKHEPRDPWLALPGSHFDSWGACNDNIKGHIPVQCHDIEVPLDHEDRFNIETLTIPLLRVPARRHPSKGNIIFHFGGPGSSGRKSLAYWGPILQAITGGWYDLVSWDQR